MGESDKAEKLLKKVKEDYLLLQNLAEVLPAISIDFINSITERIRCLERACDGHTLKALTYLIGVCYEKQIGVELTDSERKTYFKLLEKENEKYELNRSKNIKKQGKYHV